MIRAFSAVFLAAAVAAAQGPMITSFGSACPDSNGRLLVLSAPQLPTVGNATFSFVLTMGPSSSVGFVFLALAPANPSIAIGGGCTVYLDLTSVNELAAIGLNPLGPVPTSLMGQASVGFPIPNLAGLAGATFFAQGVALDPPLSLGFVTSNALQLTIG